MVKTTIHTLPDEFGLPEGEVLIYFYKNNRSSRNNKVVFTRNMFCLLQQGVKEVQTSTGKVAITNNEILLLNAGSVLMSETVAKGNKYEAVLVFFSNQLLADFCANNKVTLPREAAELTPLLKLNRDAFLDNFCRSLYLLPKGSHTAMDEVKIRELLAYISLQYPMVFGRFARRALDAKDDVVLRQVVELHGNEGLTLEELAFLCHMSVSTFKRHFAAVYKTSPQKYFVQRRMERARLLLGQLRRPTEIYRELGYENLSAFSAEFKKHFGVSPRQIVRANEPPAKVVELTA